MSNAFLSDYARESYEFELPASSIAQYPPIQRGTSRLLVFKRSDRKKTPTCIHTQFDKILDYLPPNALLVANNSKVIPARLQGVRSTGGRFEFLLLTPLPLLQPTQDAKGYNHVVCEGLLKMGGKVHLGLTLQLTSDLSLTILELGEFGRHKIELTYKGDLKAQIMQLGQVPLPPYIKRQVNSSDLERYQTVYASQAGSVAAPTAGLHFTKDLQAKLIQQGIGWQEVTLYVGYGTFSPIRCPDIRDHVMHKEYIEVSAATAKAILEAKAAKRPIIAVGTTSVRTLEGVVAKLGHLQAYAGWTDIFLYPGQRFHLVDGLITNFHLPASSLLMLVAAFVGREQILNVYQEALSQDYKFFSYGDAMLILP